MKKNNNNLNIEEENQNLNNDEIKRLRSIISTLEENNSRSNREIWKLNNELAIISRENFDNKEKLKKVKMRNKILLSLIIIFFTSVSLFMWNSTKFREIAKRIVSKKPWN